MQIEQLWEVTSALVVCFFYVVCMAFDAYNRIIRNPSLIRYSGVILFSFFVWTFSFFVIYYFELFPPSDSIFHIEHAYNVAHLIETQDFPSLGRYLMPGNDFFRLAAGIYFLLTDLDPLTVRFASIICGFSGAVCLLDVIVRLNNGYRIPQFLVFVVLCLPSFIFWSSDFLKDGFTFACNCHIIALLFPRHSGATKHCLHNIPVVPAWIALTLLTLLRPHHAMAWFAALSLGPAFSSGKVLKASGFALLGCVGLAALYVIIPDVIDGMLQDGAVSTLQGEYDERSHIGGSSLGSGKTIPVITGAFLVFARPLPGEVPGFAGLVSSLEAMCICLLALGCLVRLISYRKKIMKEPVSVGCAIAIFFYCFLLTYTYNLGLLVRLRISVLPAILAFFIPIFCGGLLLQSRNITGNYPQNRILSR